MADLPRDRIAEIDVDEDGSIDFDEFVRWWTTD